MLLRLRMGHVVTAMVAQYVAIGLPEAVARQVAIVATVMHIAAVHVNPALAFYRRRRQMALADLLSATRLVLDGRMANVAQALAIAALEMHTAGPGVNQDHATVVTFPSTKGRDRRHLRCEFHANTFPTDYQGLDSGDPNTISGSAGGLTRDMWDQVEATHHASDEDLTTFNFAFANPWGLGQSMSSCKPNAGCLRYDCNQFGDQINREKGAAAYMILISMQNVKLMLESLYGAAQYAWVYIDGTQAKFLDEFNPAMPDDNDLFTKELINGFAGLFAVAAAATGNPIAGAVGAFVSAISSGVLEAFPDSDDTRMSDLAALESAITLPLNKTQTSLTQMQTDFAFHGQSGNTHYTDIFPHGAVVDWRTVALLNEGLLSSAQLDQIFVRHVQAMVINWSWHAARTWIFSYPMTREDFDSRESQAGSNDFRLKHYYNGRGYFFQSVQATQEGAYVTPWVQNPPGWGALSSSNISFSTWDVIESSADGFDLGGYGYNPLDNINADFIKNASPDILSDSVKLPGFFNIPICPLDKSPLGVNDLDSFFGILAPVGARWSPGPENNGGTYNSPFCYCLGIKDQNGKAFEDEIDVKNWAYGQNDFCDSVV
ncbi:MAG: hypothetical protein M1820_007833 [Bogoriella megaspora]|nr:MAG: hypothetical protein M1820_007833 [Bogoriella megaspora]